MDADSEKVQLILDNTDINCDTSAAIYVRQADKVFLTLGGPGKLTLQAAYGHGIVSKDDLVITGGNYQITAAKHALSGKDSVRVADGTLTLDAGSDGIHSENTEDEEKGFIYVAGGNLSITSASDGLDAEDTLQIDGGTMKISAGDDGVHSDADLKAEKAVESMFTAPPTVETEPLTMPVQHPSHAEPSWLSAPVACPRISGKTPPRDPCLSQFPTHK